MTFSLSTCTVAVADAAQNHSNSAQNVCQKIAAQISLVENSQLEDILWVWQRKRVSPLNLSLLFLGSKKVSGMLHRRRMSSCESSKRLSRSQSAKRYRKKKSIIGLVLTDSAPNIWMCRTIRSVSHKLKSY